MHVPIFKIMVFFAGTSDNIPWHLAPLFQQPAECSGDSAKSSKNGRESGLPLVSFGAQHQASAVWGPRIDNNNTAISAMNEGTFIKDIISLYIVIFLGQISQGIAVLCSEDFKKRLFQPLVVFNRIFRCPAEPGASVVITFTLLRTYVISNFLSFRPL